MRYHSWMPHWLSRKVLSPFFRFDSCRGSSIYWRITTQQTIPPCLMIVLFITPRFSQESGGDGLYAFLLARQLQRLQHTVIVFTIKNSKFVQNYSTRGGFLLNLPFVRNMRRQMPMNWKRTSIRGSPPKFSIIVIRMFHPMSSIFMASTSTLTLSVD